MKVDINAYRLNKPFIIAYMNGHKDQKFSESVSLLAISSHVPVIAILHYIGEEFGYSEEVLKAIKSIETFYDYEAQ